MAPTNWDKSSLGGKDIANKRSRFGTRGMGLMGAGMLAQTAIMGLEMAGKEVPNAVNFAVNGLMGIGMASMFFPDMMPKLATGLSTVAAKGSGKFLLNVIHTI